MFVVILFVALVVFMIFSNVFHLLNVALSSVTIFTLLALPHLMCMVPKMSRLPRMCHPPKRHCPPRMRGAPRRHGVSTTKQTNYKSDVEYFSLSHRAFKYSIFFCHCEDNNALDIIVFCKHVIYFGRQYLISKRGRFSTRLL